MEEMNNFVKNIISAGGITEQEIMREKLPLDSAPFKYAKKVHLNIQEMTKDDEIRVAFQALFLFILRPYIPIKCMYPNMFYITSYNAYNFHQISQRIRSWKNTTI